jgi:hypothetical protein
VRTIIVLGEWWATLTLPDWGKGARHLTKNGFGLSYRFCYRVVKAHLVATRRAVSISTSLSAAVRASGALTLKSGSTPVSCARVNQIGNLETCRYEPVVKFGPSAQTQLTFDFSFSGAGISGSGTLAATLVSGNEFLVTSISGTQNGCGRDLTMAAHDSYRANRVGLTPSEPDIPNLIR